MSNNRPLLPPLEPGTYRAADGTIRRFSHHPSASNDRPADTTSERLYTVIRQIHEDLDRFSQQIFGAARTNAPDPPRMASGSDRDLRPRFNRDPQPSNDPLFASAASPDPPSLPPLRSLGSRARPPLATFAGSGPRASRYRPADRYLDRYRSHFGAASALEDLDRNIHETDAQLRALLDLTNNASTMPRAPPTVSPPLNGHDMAEENRRIKRRKLDSDRVASNFKGFSYGKYGQVEPGPLTMEIVSCDGGLYADEHSYPPENILKNDTSVYCTKSNRCNIVLKHQGGTVFSLKELVIKAPGSKFSCPVREGMVFVSMESDDLLTRTAQYQIQYLPARSHRRGTVIFRHEDDGTGVVRVQTRPLRAYSYGADDDDDDDDDEDDNRTAQIPPEFTAAQAPFNVITECSEDEESDEDHHPQHPRPPARRRTPNRIGALPFESDSEDDSIHIFGAPYRHWPPTEADPAPDPTGATAAARRRSRLARLERLATTNAATNGSGYAYRASFTTTTTGTGTGTSGMTLEEAQEASQIATQEAVRAVGGELMAPLAHFFIEKDKNKCTVRFEPPVTGRFLLLKMWSPHQDPGKNIDIQAVVAKGFAGPRFVPAFDLA